MNQSLLSRRRVLAALSAVGFAGWAGTSAAQSTGWPGKPIRIIVNVPPGSSPDVVGRAVAAGLQESLGQPVVVENRSGAAGTLGAEFVAKSPADGYTLLMTSGSVIAINPHLYPGRSFDASRDLMPVAAAARIQLFLVARPELAVGDFKAFIAHMKANPGRLTYGSPGVGSTPHLAGEMLKSMTGVFAVHIPYRGAAPALQDLLAGQIDFLFDPGIALQHVRSARLRLLAVGSGRRSSAFPQAPTLDELGLRGFDAGTTNAFYAPLGTPAEVVTRLNREINRMLATPSVQGVIASLGGEATPMSPAELRALSEQDSRRFGAIVRERGIKPE